MTIDSLRGIIAQIAPAYPVISIDLFGSYASEEDTDASDVDLLVHFDESKASLFDLSGLKLDLQDKLQKKVDVVAGPLKKGSHLTIKKKVRIYEA